jgi:hypothetical protein
VPNTRVNAFMPANPFGAGIANLARALAVRSSGARETQAQADLRAAQAEAARGSAELRDSQTSFYNAKTSEIENAPQRARDLALEGIAATLGTKPRAQVANQYFETGSFGKDQNVGAMTGSLDEQDIPITEAPRPEWFTPQVEQNVNRSRIILGRKGNEADDLAKALNILDTIGRRDAVIADPKNATNTSKGFAATSGHMPFSQNAVGSVLNGVEGTVDQSNPLAQGVISLNKDKATHERASAAHQSASAGTANARTRDINDSRALVPALKPDGSPIVDSEGKPVLIQQKERGAIMSRGDQARATNDAKPPKVVARRPLTTTQSKQLAGALDEASQGTPIDEALKREIVSEATNATTDPDSEFHQDPVGAINAAIAARGGLKRERVKQPGDWLIPSPRMVAGGAPRVPGVPPGATPAPAAPVPATNAAAPPAQREVGKVYPTPRGNMKWTGTGWLPAN